MTKSFFKPILAGLLAVALVGVAVSTRAEDKPEAKAEAPAPAAKGRPYGGTISAVDKTAMTVSVKKKDAEKVFSITSSTKITKAGKPATLDDAAVGEDAGVYYVEADGKAEAKSLRIGPKPEKAEKKEKAEGEKKAE